MSDASTHPSLARHSSRSNDTTRSRDATRTTTSALPNVPAPNAIARGAQLRFFHGPMDCGKSTLALQINHNHARQGRRGLLITQLDRSGAPSITSRMGTTAEAIEVDPGTNFIELVRRHWVRGERVDYLIVDEAQFLLANQVEQLAELVDEAGIDCYCFGLTTDFRSRLFEGSQRLLELADEVERLQVEVLCWCGRLASMNGRLVDGRLVRHGAQVLVADVTATPAQAHYQVLCRRHWRTGDVGIQRPTQDPLPLGGSATDPADQR